MRRLKRQGADEQKSSSPPARPERRQVHIGTKELSALLRIAETATQSLDTEQILNDTLDESLAFLGFEIGFIRTLEPSTKLPWSMFVVVLVPQSFCPV